MCEQPEFRFDPREWGLLGSALLEVIHGFKVPDFNRTIGTDKSSLQQLIGRIDKLCAHDELVLNAIEANAVRNALRETIRELGCEEFHTRTGYDLEQGEALLEKLNGLLGGDDWFMPMARGAAV